MKICRGTKGRQVRCSMSREKERESAHLPRGIELVVSDKVGVVSLDGVKDESLVRCEIGKRVTQNVSQRVGHTARSEMMD